jgi:hypothetical protein
MNRIGTFVTTSPELPTVVGLSWTTSEEHDGWRAVLTHGSGSANYRLVDALVPVKVRVVLDRSYDDGLPPSTQLVIQHGAAIGDEGSEDGETRIFLKEPTALRALIAALQAIADNPDGAAILATTENIRFLPHDNTEPAEPSVDVENDEHEDDDDDEEGEEWKSP